MKRMLTPREIDVLKLGALGHPDQAIARMLGVQSNSVKTYFVHIRKKIGKFNRSMLPGVGLLLGIVSAEDLAREARACLSTQYAAQKCL